MGYNQRIAEMWAIDCQLVRWAQEAAGDAKAQIVIAVNAVAQPSPDDTCVVQGVQAVVTHCSPLQGFGTSQMPAPPPW